MASFRTGESDCDLVRSLSVVFTVGRQSRTDFALGVSIGTTDGVSKWPENQGSSAFFEGRHGSPRGASSSHYQREGELVFTAVAKRSWGSMAQFVANRCHTPYSPRPLPRARGPARQPRRSLRG